jgi:hypothetical protein
MLMLVLSWCCESTVTPSFVTTLGQFQPPRLQSAGSTGSVDSSSLLLEDWSVVGAGDGGIGFT